MYVVIFSTLQQTTLFKKGFYFMLTWLPTYYSAKFNINFDELGWFAMLPFAIQGVACIACGFVADLMISKLKLTVKNTRKIMNSIGMFGPAIMLILCTFAAPNIYLAVTYICLCLGLASFTNAYVLCTNMRRRSSYSANHHPCTVFLHRSVSVNHLDICIPKYAALVYSIGNTFSNITGIIGPLIVGMILDATNSWALVLLIMVALYLVGGIFWLIFGQGEVIIGKNEQETL